MLDLVGSTWADEIRYFATDGQSLRVNRVVNRVASDSDLCDQIEYSTGFPVKRDTRTQQEGSLSR